MRKNGFQAPLEPLQIVTWALFILLVCGFYGVLLPGLPSSVGVPCAIVYGLMAALSLVFGYIACRIDPVDPNVLLHRSGTVGHDSASPDKTFCFLCQLYVTKGSRHCRYCDKCVESFDHHCRWLNNCVGRKNYRHFLALLLSTFFMTSLQLSLSLWRVVVFHSDREEYKDELSYSGSTLGATGHVALVYCFAVLLLPFVGLLLQLLGFHVVLMREGLTTYDYIVREQRRERERRARRAAGRAGAGGNAGLGGCAETDGCACANCELPQSGSAAVGGEGQGGEASSSARGVSGGSMASSAVPQQHEASTDGGGT